VKNFVCEVIFLLCVSGELYDQDALQLQLKVLRYVSIKPFCEYF